MPFGAKSKEEQEASRSGDFGTLPEEDYVFEVVSFVDLGKKTNAFPHPKTGLFGEHDDIRFTVKPLFIADSPDAELVDDDGNPINPAKTLLVFFKPQSLGFGPAGPSKNRQFMAAALGRNIRESFDGIEYQDFVGGRFIGTVEQNAKGYDTIVGYRPFKDKATRNRTAPAVAAAKEVFDVVDDEEELPF